MKSSKPSINNKEDSNSFAPALSSKKDTPQWTSAQHTVLKKMKFKENGT